MISRNDIERYAAWARVNLGMHRSEFGGLTPVEFADLVKAWDDRQRRDDYRVARLCYVIAASAGAEAPGGEPVTIQHFLPSRYAPKRQRRRRYTGEQLLAQFMACTSNLPVEDKRNGK